MKEKKNSLKWRAALWCAVMAGILLVIVAAGWAVLSGRSARVPVTRELLESLPLEGFTRMMVVAHPDDETFWGGAHLAQEPCLVVCLTDGYDPVRRDEFERAVKMTGSVPLILDYPDKVLGIRSRWIGYYDDIEADLQTLFDFRGWEMVFTHNPDGEYGHLHHRRTSRLVTEAARAHPDTRLYYFGRYRTELELAVDEAEGTLPDCVGEHAYGLKRRMIAVYQSQKKTAEEFSHMFPYEEWYAAQ